MDMEVPVFSRSRREPAGVRPSLELLREILSELDIRSFDDDEGDLGCMWEGCRIYFFLAGPHQEILRVQALLDRRCDIEDKPLLLDIADDWNRTRMFGKAYTSVGDDGRVGLCAEHVFDFAVPVARPVLVSMVRWWIASLLKFAGWVGERV
jgi:hypothetical protein